MENEWYRIEVIGAQKGRMYTYGERAASASLAVMATGGMRPRPGDRVGLYRYRGDVCELTARCRELEVDEFSAVAAAEYAARSGR